MYKAASEGAFENGAGIFTAEFRVIASHEPTTQFAGIQADLELGKDLLQKLFQANISPKTKNYLLSLTGDQIREIATCSGFSINDRQIHGILARIAAICKRE